MKKIIFIILTCLLVALAGCSDSDKAGLVGWMHELDAKQTTVYFWSQELLENPDSEIKLTPEETQALLSVLSRLDIDDITWNKTHAGITPTYGFHLIIDGEDYYINQAGSPHGQTEISFQGKLWLIESETLHALMQAYQGIS